MGVSYEDILYYNDGSAVACMYDYLRAGMRKEHIVYERSIHLLYIVTSGCY